MFSAWIGIKREADIDHKPSDFIFKTLGFAMIVVSTAGLVRLCYHHGFSVLPASTGGILGDVVAGSLIRIFNAAGSSLFLVTGLLCGITYLPAYPGFGSQIRLVFILCKVATSCEKK